MQEAFSAVEHPSSSFLCVCELLGVSDTPSQLPLSLRLLFLGVLSQLGVACSAWLRQFVHANPSETAAWGVFLPLSCLGLSGAC